MLGTMLNRATFWAAALLWTVGLSFGISQAWAQGPRAKTPHVTVELLSDFATWEPGQKQTLGLHFTIIPHWHTYWINPGDSGEPVKVQWESTPIGIQFSELQFPYPEPLPVGPLMNFGYSGEVTFLSTLTVPFTAKPDRPLEIRAKVHWLVCEEECIPEQAELVLKLPSASGKAPIPSPSAALIAQAREKMPRPWTGGSPTFKQQNGLVRLDLPWTQAEAPLATVRFFPLQGGQIANAAIQEVSEAKNLLQMKLTLEPTASKALSELPGVLVAGDKAYLLTARPASTAPSWALYLGLAFLGGLILNLMPCVFPVLSLKILHWVYQAREAPGPLRRQGWAYTAGVMMTFWTLSLILILLRLAGKAVGWGFQFQSPYFNMALGFLFFLMGLALLGALPLKLPGSSGFLSRQSGAGLRGAFLTGILATIAATPCMAPLVGSTLGLALTQVSWFGVALLTAMALGLAAPSLLLSYFPALLKKLPRPGAWMQTLEQLLAFPLFATVLWLYWVLQQQTGDSITLPFWGGILFLAFGVWWLHRLGSPATSTWKYYAKRIPAWLVILGGMTWSFSQISQAERNPRASVHQEASSLPWQAFSPDQLEAFRKEGQPVFINFTAAWCVTCQVNDRLVFRNPQVIEKFSEAGVVSLKADWTHPDPVITETLNRFGRQGVPLYVFYDRKGNYHLLPELLTPGILIDAIFTEKPDET